MSIDKSLIRSEILHAVKEPEELRKERISEIEKIVSKLNELKRKEGLEFEVFIGGSLAKGTDIKGSDVDVFLLFGSEFDPFRVLSALRETFPDGKEEYSEHPYITLERGGFSVDLVPGYRVASPNDLRTSVDRTPLHVEFVKKTFDEEMKDEARILKQFLKGIGVYGAESSVRGMSGYVAELLIYQFRTFENVLKEASKWRIPVVIGNAPKEFNGASMVLMDPVDTERNAAANVSRENIATFILAASLFRWERWKEFFFPKQGTFSMPEGTVVIRFVCRKCNPEIVIPNLRRASEVLTKELESKGFRVQYSSVLLEKTGYITIVPEATYLGDAELHIGPPVNSRNVSSFLGKWGSGTRFGMPFILGDRIAVLKERRVRKIEEAVAEIIPKVKMAKDLDPKKVLIISGKDLGSLPERVRAGIVTPSLGEWASHPSGDVQRDDPESNES
ncbi:MAG: CCA tRNA nucleotidyltransferase [Thermoplasmata archaeon]